MLFESNMPNSTNEYIAMISSIGHQHDALPTHGYSTEFAQHWMQNSAILGSDILRDSSLVLLHSSSCDNFRQLSHAALHQLQSDIFGLAGHALIQDKQHVDTWRGNVVVGRGSTGCIVSCNCALQHNLPLMGMVACVEPL